MHAGSDAGTSTNTDTMVSIPRGLQVGNNQTPVTPRTKNLVKIRKIRVNIQCLWLYSLCISFHNQETTRFFLLLDQYYATAKTEGGLQVKEQEKEGRLNNTATGKGLEARGRINVDTKGGKKSV